ncbi:hypothetical protein IT570_01905 [Candidatus Sumerlaeota bacterium]|nr:hypothetical protein [Candidatus Sumerlaeota bacterium]
MNEMCHQPTSAREVLAKLISAPCVLAGRDLLTGERFTRLHAEDLDDFVDAHLLGPGRRARPARITVYGEAGERRVESFLRPELLPVAGDETCTHIVVTVRTANAAEPDDGLLATAIALREKTAHLFLERSVMTGVWCLWVLFDSPLVKADAVAFAEDVRRALQVFATHSLHYSIPLLDGDGSSGTLIPCPFYSAGFLGVLFSISHDAYLTALPVEPRSDGDAALEGLLASWCAVCPGRSARAGEIISVLKEDGMLQGTFAHIAPDSSAILLGRQLLAYARRNDGQFVVIATKSGHSKRFSIRHRERSPA